MYTPPPLPTSFSFKTFKKFNFHMAHMFVLINKIWIDKLHFIYSLPSFDYKYSPCCSLTKNLQIIKILNIIVTGSWINFYISLQFCKKISQKSNWNTFIWYFVNLTNNFWYNFNFNYLSILKILYAYIYLVHLRQGYRKVIYN